MSYHAEHIIWKSKNNTWSYGVFKRISTEDNPNQWREDEYDSEWDDHFDLDHFFIAQGGFLSAQVANSEMRRRIVNPGYHEAQSNPSKEDRDKWDDMLKAANDPAYAVELEKKREKAAKAAYQRQIRDNLRSLNLVAGKSYTVRFTSRGPATTPFGMFVTYTGWLKQDGDWLVLTTTKEDSRGRKERVSMRVWNQKTRRQASNVVSATEDRAYFLRR